MNRQHVLPGIEPPVNRPAPTIGRPRKNNEPRPMMPCRICDVSTEARRAQPSGKWVRAACRSCNSIQQRVSTYGCTWEDANAPKPADGRCEICARDVPLEWDHDHATGRFRAWLCRHCNAGLMVWVDNLRSAGIADDAMRSMLATALDTYRRPDHV